MRCEFSFCIYNKNAKCILDEVEINAFGMCDDCIIVSVNADFIDAEKEKYLLMID
jgi:hypothetical protein